MYVHCRTYDNAYICDCVYTLLDDTLSKFQGERWVSWGVGQHSAASKERDQEHGA